MEQRTHILLIVWLVTLVAGTLFALLFLHRDWRRAALGLLLTLLVPVIGLFLNVILLFRLRRARYAMDVDETIRKSKIKESVYIDESRERNTVPSLDALSISGNRDRRGYLLGLLRQYELASLQEVLSQALRNPDSEASHYAASALMELQRQSYNTMSQAQAIYEKAPDDYTAACAYANAILTYLSHSEAGNVENAELQGHCEEVFLHILRDMEGQCQEEDYSALIRLYLRRERNRDAWDWANAYVASYPLSETGYLLMMEAAYQDSDAAAFREALDALRAQRDITLSREGLLAVRFWMQDIRPAAKSEETAEESHLLLSVGGGMP